MQTIRPASPGALLALIRERGECTRAELVELTGMARSTVADRVDRLADHRLIKSVGEERSTGGRRPATFAFNDHYGVVLTADVGATHTRLGVSDLAARPLAETADDRSVTGDPAELTEWMTGRWSQLLGECERSADDVLCVGVGVPATVAFRSGSVYLPGWTEFPMTTVLSEAFGVPTLVDNDVNLMALGEHWSAWREASDLLFVKFGTGIGSGIVSDGEIFRGSDGAAGDIGHFPVPGADDVRCTCGSRGCLEAVTGGAAMVAQLQAEGVDASDARDVVALVAQGHPRAIELVRNAGRLLGGALAFAVNVLNPTVLVLGGDVAHADEQLLPGVREAIYSRSLPLATRNLRVVRSNLDERAGVIGAAVMSIQHVLSPEVIDREVLDERVGATASVVGAG